MAKPQCQTHSVTKPPHGRIRAAPLLQCGRTGRVLRVPGNIRRPTCQNPWAHAPPPQHPHFGLPLHTPHSHQLASVGLLGVTLTIGQTPWGSSQGAWHHNDEDWGPPSPSARLTLSPSHHTGESGHATHSGQEKGQVTVSTRQYLKNPRTTMLRPTLPLPNVLILACHTTRPSAVSSHPRASRGLTLTLGLPQSGLSQGAW